MAQEFDIGNIVRLKSGGPDMTVVQRDGDNLQVRWATNDIFPVQCVTPITEARQN